MCHQLDRGYSDKGSLKSRETFLGITNHFQIKDEYGLYLCTLIINFDYQIFGLALAMKLLQSCTKPSK